MSFVWLGLAILVLPTPGGKAPDWLRGADDAEAAVVPFADHRQRCCSRVASISA